jgi:hypothetical protein
MVQADVQGRARRRRRLAAERARAPRDAVNGLALARVSYRFRVAT